MVPCPDELNRYFSRASVVRSLHLKVVSTIVFLFVARPVMADVAEDAERLALAWAQRGAQTSRLSPIFAEHGQSKVIEIFPKGIDESKPGCITVALLGAPTIDFAAAPLLEGVPLDVPLLPDGHPLVAAGAEGTRSVIGVATLKRCDEARWQLARIAVTMRAPRAAIDIVVARSPVALGEPREVLPERVAGVIAPRGNPGRPIEPGSLVDRVTRAEERARAEGAQAFTRTPVVATPEGAGEARLRLTEGCHRISIMATVPNTFPHRATDVDAEARDDSGRVLARDRSETADSRLDFCVGETARVSVVYAGASGAVPVMVTDAAWPMPAAVPNHWGSRVRAGFALALRRRHAPAPPSPPTFESLGSSGPTMVPVPLEPGRCYLAAVSVLRGDST